MTVSTMLVKRNEWRSMLTVTVIVVGGSIHEHKVLKKLFPFFVQLVQVAHTPSQPELAVVVAAGFAVVVVTATTGRAPCRVVVGIDELEADLLSAAVRRILGLPPSTVTVTVVGKLALQ